MQISPAHQAAMPQAPTVQAIRTTLTQLPATLDIGTNQQAIMDPIDERDSEGAKNEHELSKELKSSF